MKKYFLILSCIFITSLTNAQIQPIESIYIWVRFSDDKILLDFPDSYITYRTVLPALPPTVGIRTVLRAVPQIQNNEILKTIITAELNQTDHLFDKQNQLNYLGKLSLMLFYSGNDKSWFHKDIQQQFNKLLKDSYVKREALLVKQWMDWKKL